MEYRRALLAAVLSIGVIVVWQLIFPPAPAVSPEAPPPAVEVATAGSADAPVEAEASARAGGDPPADPGTLGDGASAASARSEDDTGAPPAELETESTAPLEADAELTLFLETREYRAQFSNHGAELVGLELWNHQESDGELVDLVQARPESQPYPFGLLSRDGTEAHPLSQALFAATEAIGADGAASLVFEYRGPLGRARKRFWAADDGSIRAEIEADGEWSMLWGPGVRSLDFESKESRFAARSLVYRRDGDFERTAVGRVRELDRFSGGLDWVGQDDTYFLSIVAPLDGMREAVVVPLVQEGTSFRRLADGEKVDKKSYREAQVVIVPEAQSLRLATYLGTKEFEKLTALPRDLGEAGQLTGFLGALARPLQIGLRWIHNNMVGNYGWAIVLLTVVVKLLLFPLTQKSMVSMQRMQELNPKIQGIRQKFRSKLKDKQGRPNAEAQRKMNEEIMALYKQEGVNPAGGCLPMLVQLPVFFALFRLLGSAIELRNAPWMLWIRDLSAPDSMYVLPILMGASQLIQQKLTPATGDPMQRRLMTFMPIMFVFFAFTFPSGLVLYWLTSNILTIIQQQLYNRWKAWREAAAS